MKAERAAKLAAFELVKKLTNNEGMDPNDRWGKVNLLLAYRQTARQEALREARQAVLDYDLSDDFANHQNLDDAQERMCQALDRLASEEKEWKR